MILSDVTIREELAAGRIVIEPLGEGAVQPSSVDLRVDRYFRVFRNDTTPYIDPKKPQEDLTELVEVGDDGAFILHPGEFVLGSTLERVALPDDLVARLEGKSSGGRLGLLIHSSLPASERVMVLTDGRLELRSIAEIVTKQLDARVVSFDPETFRVGYHEITGWYEGPSDRIFEVGLRSGRRVRLTAGHNLFTVDPDGNLAKLRTCELRTGLRVAVPRRIPDAPVPCHDVALLDVIPEHERDEVVCQGPAARAAFEEHGPQIGTMFREAGLTHVDYYRERSKLPLAMGLQIEGFARRLGREDRLMFKGSRSGLPPRIAVDVEVAWVLGLYVAEGSRRRTQFTISNTDQAILDRAEAVLLRLGLRVYRAPGAITCASRFASAVLHWLGTGERAPTKRVPPIVYAWPYPLVAAFLEGMVDGDSRRDDTRTSVWTTSEGLVGDLLYLAARLGRRAGTTWKSTPHLPLCQISLPHREHKLISSVPLPSGLLIALRRQLGLSQNEASTLIGYLNPTDLDNLERRHGRDATRCSTLQRIRDAYASAGSPEGQRLLDRLVDGDLMWDEVVTVRDTGCEEPIYDIEIRPDGRRIENFLAGYGGVFVSNTAGFVDAGWDGHLTLELSNVANLPIAIYPGMKIGQISFLRMTTAAEHPYGSGDTGSKYQGQRGPTPSRYYLNFGGDADE